MDLGIAGRKAIVCASSKGLGRACARALAEAGCAIVLNGRDAETLARTGRELREATGVEVREILGDLDDAATRSELIADALAEAFPAHGPSSGRCVVHTKALSPPVLDVPR